MNEATVNDRRDSLIGSFITDAIPTDGFTHAVYAPCPPFAMGEVVAIFCGDNAERNAKIFAQAYNQQPKQNQ